MARKVFPGKSRKRRYSEVSRYDEPWSIQSTDLCNNNVFGYESYYDSYDESPPEKRMRYSYRFKA